MQILIILLVFLLCVFCIMVIQKDKDKVIGAKTTKQATTKTKKNSLDEKLRQENKSSLSTSNKTVDQTRKESFHELVTVLDNLKKSRT
jgi:ABC-type uncharacterized transport system substrate-binding protein